MHSIAIRKLLNGFISDHALMSGRSPVQVASETKYLGLLLSLGGGFESSEKQSFGLPDVRIFELGASPVN